MPCRYGLWDMTIIPIINSIMTGRTIIKLMELA